MRIRQQAEREIVRATIEAVIKHVYLLHSVDNGEDITEVRTVDEAMELAFACDEAYINFRSPQITQHIVAWIYIVLGNEGWTVISDYTTNLDDAIKDTDALVEAWEEKLS